MASPCFKSLVRVITDMLYTILMNPPKKANVIRYGISTFSMVVNRAGLEPSQVNLPDIALGYLPTLRR